MPVRTPRTPSYRHHRPSGQAVVTLDARDNYLGRFGSPESRAEYDRLVGEWLTRGRRAAGPDGAGQPPVNLTVAEVLVAYLRFAEQYYRKDGRVSPDVGNIRLALKPVRREMVAAGLCRKQINHRVGRVVRVFKWAASEELVPGAVHQALRSVAGLQPGRTEARESSPVRPVPDELVDAVRPFVSRQVWAMVELQRLAAMRPGEACIMRTGDVDRSGEVWAYTPESHKTKHRGKDRTIFLGPRVQAVLRPWLRADPAAYLFSPAEAVAERRAASRASRKSRAQPSQADRSKAEPKRAPRERYDTRTYHHAVRYGCRRAGVEDWHPHRLRHTAATRIRREFGLEAARAILGHSELTFPTNR